MSSISIVTTMTDPDLRQDPWKEALNCYNSFADEVIVVGADWPYEFKWEEIGKTFQEGFDKASGDWIIRMDLDYFFHQNDFLKIKKVLKRFEEYPVVSFPQYQFFSPEKYSIRTLLSVAINKKKFPTIKLNGGGDLCLPTIDDKLIPAFKNPISKYPIYQYDSFFRERETIAEDRARFARAWNRQFNNFQDRGGPEKKEAFEAWENMIKERIGDHIFNFKLKNHPVFIIEKIKLLKPNLFGYNAFNIKYKSITVKKLLLESKKLLKIFLVRKKFEIKTIW